MLGTGRLRTRVASSSMLRTGGMIATTAPITSFSTPISGSHGAFRNGASDQWTRILPNGGMLRPRRLGLLRSVLLYAALSMALIACSPAPESSLASCRNSSSSTASMSAPAARPDKAATTSPFVAFSIARRTLAASCLSS